MGRSKIGTNGFATRKELRLVLQSLAMINEAVKELDEKMAATEDLLEEWQKTLDSMKKGLSPTPSCQNPDTSTDC